MIRPARLSHKATVSLSRPVVVRRHLASVEGLEHVPTTGGFVLISNHLSFADHFFYEALLYAARGEPAAFLTKAESFTGLRGRWFASVGALPVDRDNPARAALDIADRVLGEGRVLVVYPEGTRNPSEHLLPFKDGACRFADRAGVPVVPAALAGTGHILPIGATLPRPGLAQVVFGEPLWPDRQLPRAERIREFNARCRAAVRDLAALAGTADRERRRQAASATAGLADAVLEQAVAQTDPDRASHRHRQARLLLGMARASDPDSVAVQIAEARLLGLRALASRLPVNPVLLLRVRAAARRALRRDPDQPMAHYLLGRWHLAVPAALGGNPDAAVRHLAIAAELDRADTRYGTAYAEALLAAGRRDEAVTALEKVIVTPVRLPRDRQRRLRAIRQREALITAGAAAPAGRPTLITNRGSSS